MNTASVRISTELVTIAAALTLFGSTASAVIVTVTVAPKGQLVFSPTSVTIHPGDTVQWIWADSGHSSTSGNPGSPNGLWNSGILNRGATFSHTFNTAGSFHYYCIPHGLCCGMIGFVTVSNPTPTPTPTPTPSAAPATDFNNDGKPDYVLYNSSTRQTAIWYLNNNVLIAGRLGPTLPAGWSVVAVADFNGDGHPDYLLFNAGTRQTVIWYLNNTVLIAGRLGPTLPAGWSVAGLADFNRDGHPDYLLFNPSTGQTVIWYLNNTVLITGRLGPTLPAGWSVLGVADFNGDGHPDYLLFNADTRQTAIWYLNNSVLIAGRVGPTLPAGWSVVAP
jgi:plastocyanin